VRSKLAALVREDLADLAVFARRRVGRCSPCTRRYFWDGHGDLVFRHAYAWGIGPAVLVHQVDKSCGTRAAAVQDERQARAVSSFMNC